MLLGSGAGDSGTDIYPDDNFKILDYKGNSSVGHRIYNGIDFSDGGMVLIKNWESGNKDWLAVDTVQGVGIQNRPNKSDAKETHSALITSFNNDGITVANNSQSNNNGDRHQAFCFRKRAKFFDVVTYNGSSSAQSIAHNLGCEPGMIWTKKTNGNQQWAVYHRRLNGGSNPWNYRTRFPSATTESAQPYWNNTAPTSTHFTVGTDQETGVNGGEYVAYLFAHDQNAFGPDENKPMSFCGDYTGQGSNDATINCGFEPQFLIINRVTGGTSYFYVLDNQRGMSGYGLGNDPWMALNTDSVSSGYSFGHFNSNGFVINQNNADINSSGDRYIFYAIRAQDGQTSPAIPKLPTDVFHVGYGDATTDIIPQFKTNWKVSMGFTKNPTANENWNCFIRGNGNHTSGHHLRLNTNDTNQSNSSYKPTNHEGWMENESSVGNDVFWTWRESSGFTRAFYKGTGTAQYIPHKLGSQVEMMWIKNITNNRGWTVYHTNMNQGASGGADEFYMYLNESDARVAGDNQRWDAHHPGTTNFRVGTSDDTNEGNQSFVCLMFRSVTGVSKCGYYTGSGSDNTVSLGFSPRLIIIKRADSAGNWIILDTVNGLGTGADQENYLNNHYAQGTNDFVDLSGNNMILKGSWSTSNASGGKYIYYAHA